MPAVNVVKPNFFRDSLQLMKLSEEAKKLQGVEDAVIAMGTETNKRLMKDLGLLDHRGEGARDGDLVLAVRVGEGCSAEEVADMMLKMVISPPAVAKGSTARVFHSLDSALRELPGANLAVVSVPGGQAFEPSLELLKRGVNVHLFSDHVPLDQEAELKKYASSRGLLVLGPGAGTVILNGVGLGFANSVRKGTVGIVASAGTGIQEASVLLDRAGLGVSHALGVGGSDISEEIGGVMMKDCLGLLERDTKTETIMIIAKAPTEKVMKEVMGYVQTATTKPTVACFLGLEAREAMDSRVSYAKTLHSAVAVASRKAGEGVGSLFEEKVAMPSAALRRVAREAASGLSAGQRFIRGLYSGGTLAHETLLILRELIGEPYSNTPLSERFALADPGVSNENSIVDLGDEFFTAGRAHPMIDPTIRRLRIAQEAKDPSVAMIMLDVMLGYGSSDDPGGSLIGAIVEAKASARKERRELVVAAHVCGTDTDPQSLVDQSDKLEEAGVLLFASNAQMAVAGALVVGGERASELLDAKWGGLLG